MYSESYITKMVVFLSKQLGAERARTFRTRLKVDVERYKAYKNKDKERKRVQRKGQALSPSEVASRKKLICERVRKYRQRQREKKAKKLFPGPRCITSLPNTSSSRKGSW